MHIYLIYLNAYVNFIDGCVELRELRGLRNNVAVQTLAKELVSIWLEHHHDKYLDKYLDEHVDKYFDKYLDKHLNKCHLKISVHLPRCNFAIVDSFHRSLQKNRQNNILEQS